MSTRKSENEWKGLAKTDLDQVLVEEIGQCGKFQVKLIAQSLFAVLFVAWNINEFVFTASRIETRCVIAECEDPAHTDFAPPWVTHAVPSSGGSFDNCYRFGNTSRPSPSNNTCPASLFDTSVLQRCEEYVYENTNTVVYDFGLACDEWRRSLIGSVRILGMMVALALTGYISDRWGRRRALALNASGAAALGILRYWAPSYPVYLLLMFLESMAGCGSASAAYVLTAELLGPKYRVAGGAVINSAFAVGQMTLGLIAWAVTNWRSLILALYIPQFLSIFYFWTLKESVRWLMSKGRFEESEELLKETARVNGRELSQKSLDDLRLRAGENRNEIKADKPSLVRVMLTEKKILVRFFVTSMWWITKTFVYYGLSINAVNLTGNMYLNYVTVSAVEVPGHWTAVLLLDRLGRKPFTIIAFWLCAACQLAFIFIPNDLAVLSLVAYMMGKWAISMVGTSINIFTLELYPTDCRHRFHACSAMMGRIGSIVAPFTPALAVALFPELPFILFGGMALLTGLLTFLVPETLGAKLADTMEEALALERGENNTRTSKE